MLARKAKQRCSRDCINSFIDHPEGVITFSRINVLLLQRKFADALLILQGWPEEVA